MTLDGSTEDAEVQQKRGEEQDCAHLIRGRSHHAAWVDEMASITRLCAGEPSRGCNPRNDHYGGSFLVSDRRLAPAHLPSFLPGHLKSAGAPSWSNAALSLRFSQPNIHQDSCPTQHSPPIPRTNASVLPFLFLYKTLIRTHSPLLLLPQLLLPHR